MDACCSCKCGVESPDVHYSKSRLLFSFISINLIAAALGLNELALSSSPDTILGRTALIESETGAVVIDGEEREDVTIITEYNFGDSDACQRVNDGNLGINKGDCQTIQTAAVAWLGLGVLSIFFLFVIFGFLLRIECRKLCSKAMRKICIALLSITFTLILLSWILLIVSPIRTNFDFLGSSFWVSVLASISTLIVLILSIVEYRKVGGGAAAASK